jgi:hypothetical protein
VDPMDRLAVVATAAGVTAALAAAGFTDKRRGVLTGAVTTVLVLGLCLFAGEGYAGVVGRLWPLLGSLNPALVLAGPVTAAALSQARARLPAEALRALFQAAAGSPVAETVGLRMFGLVMTAVDGTVFDLAATPEVTARFAIPSGGRFPQARPGRPGHDQPVPGADHPDRPRDLPSDGDRGMLRATLAGRTGLQDDQIHPARARTKAPRTHP